MASTGLAVAAVIMVSVAVGCGGASGSKRAWLDTESCPDSPDSADTPQGKTPPSATEVCSRIISIHQDQRCQLSEPLLDPIACPKEVSAEVRRAAEPKHRKAAESMMRCAAHAGSCNQLDGCLAKLRTVMPAL